MSEQSTPYDCQHHSACAWSGSHSTACVAWNKKYQAVTEQSTPTATDDLTAVIRFVDGDHTKGAGAIAEAVVALGWKSPAEVAELVRAGAEGAWDQASKARRFGLKNNPHRKPTPDTTEESHGRNT